MDYNYDPWGPISGIRFVEPADPPPDLSGLPNVTPGFLWGSATAGVQVEGDLSASDWDFFTNSPRIRRRVRDATAIVGLSVNLRHFDDACRHFNARHGRLLTYVQADLDRARALGHNAYRFSVEWSRVQPTPGPIDPAAVAYYIDVVHLALERGLTPIVTLNHLSLPLWILRPGEWDLFDTLNNGGSEPHFRVAPGWQSAATLSAFLAYVTAIVPPLISAGVRHFITLNEVGTIIGAGYLGGVHPPGLLLNGGLARDAYLMLIRAHVAAYDTIHSLADPTPVQVGIAHAIMHPIVAMQSSFWGQSNDAEATKQFDYFYNLHFLDAIIFGNDNPSLTYFDQDLTTPNLTPLDAAGRWAPRADFIGINYYRRVQVFHDALLAPRSVGSHFHFVGGRFETDMTRSTAPHGMLTHLGWEIFPAGLYFELRRLRDRYQLAFDVPAKPLLFLISENGLSEKADVNRSAHFVAHIQQMQAAIRDGVNVMGYLYWSLIDNWEWHEHYRPEARFGLFHVDRDTVDQTRIITDGGIAMAYVVRDGGTSLAMKRFGAIDALAQSTLSPELSAGRLYRLYTSLTDELGEYCELYCTTLSDGKLFALTYYSPQNMWFRVEKIMAGGGRLLVGHGFNSLLSHRSVRFELNVSSASTTVVGNVTVNGRRGTVQGHQTPFGFYRVPAPLDSASDPLLRDGTRGVDACVWCPLLLTGYENGRNEWVARQFCGGNPPPSATRIAPRWLPLPCTLSGTRVRLSVMATDAPSVGTPRSAEMTFNGTALVDASGQVIFERASDLLPF